MSRLYGLGHNRVKAGITQKQQYIPKQVQLSCPTNKTYATYRIDDAKVNTTTFNQSQVNPILRNSQNHTFQHPPYVRSLCELPNCQYKICKNACSSIVENADVGHATHSPTYPDVKYVSATDSNGQNRAEYMVAYNSPVENTSMGKYINEGKTTNLNNNSEALSNVHMNGSHNPTLKAYEGSNDPTNIN